MDVLLIDDGVAFDGYTPASQPLGGVEKAFANLPAALARRGHAVRVINRAGFPIIAEGVKWLGWPGRAIEPCDVLIAYRKPTLLDTEVTARRRILWLATAAGGLASAANAAILARHAEAPIVVANAIHRDTLPEALVDRATLIAPGVGAAYLQAEAMVPASPPRAIVTTHPLMDLDWVLALWRRYVRPKVEGAELHIYSAALDKGVLGGAVSERLKPILERVRAAADDGVVVQRPKGDPGMVEAYRAARVHLYPGGEREVHCATLAETQAVGVPAVARRHAAAMAGIGDGESGFAVPDHEAFASCAMLLLDNDDIFDSRSAAARERGRRRSWDDAAAEFEALFP